MTTPAAPTDPSRTLGVRGIVDTLAERLTEDILAGSLPAGSPVTEAWLAEQFTVARPSAKAAIEKVTATGLLERTAHRSARVRTLDASSVSDIYGTRRRLEAAALAELAERQQVPPEAAMANVELRAAAPGPALDLVNPDLRFHSAIVDAIGSPRLSGMYRGLLTEVRLCMTQVQGRNLLDAKHIGAEHEAILAALEQGDGPLAVALLAEHLGRAERRLIAAISPAPSDTTRDGPAS